MSRNYLERVDGFVKPYLAANGFGLIRSEFVEEDNNMYLRLYIDLSDEEAAKRQAGLDQRKEEREAFRLQAELEPDSVADESGFEPDSAGITIDDCVKVSRYLSKWLDKEDFIQEAYTLEVCSKGFLNPAEGELP